MSSPFLSTDPHTHPHDALADLVKRAIQERIVELVNIQAVLAGQEVERRVREEAASICARAVRSMVFERFGSEVTIKLDFGQTNTKGIKT
jgi:hypothetical protein